MIELLEQLSGKNILVVGDVMLDRYWWGSVNRISPEAPVPIVQMEKTSLVAGGAANVAANLAGLGVTPHLFGISGDDAEADLMNEILIESGLGNSRIFRVLGRKTTVKTRIVAHSQHVVRIDQETSETVNDGVTADIADEIERIIDDFDAIIISDYAKGFLSDLFLTRVIGSANAAGKLLVVDPKGRDFAKYRGASVLTPNKREAVEASSLQNEASHGVSRAGMCLLSQLELQALLITEGEDGMTLFLNEHESFHFDSIARTVYDVTGAGDTVISTFTAAAAAGADVVTAAKLANAAAGLVVGKIGTTSITKEMLAVFLETEAPTYPRQA